MSQNLSTSSSSYPNLIIEDGDRRTLIPWGWLIRVDADKSASSLKLIFTGSAVEATTLTPFEILNTIDKGGLRCLRVASIKKDPEAGTFHVSDLRIVDDDDEEADSNDEKDHGPET